MIELSDNPRDYGLPSDAWYAQQTKMVGASVNQQPKSILIISGPTGTGKSFAPAAVSHFRPGTTVITTTRDLQSQYADTLDFKVVWGQEHYNCANPARVKEFTETYNVAPTRADCPYPKAGMCPFCLDCPYEEAKCDALKSSKIVLNVAYAFHTNWWRHGRTNWDLFCDEAHNLPETLSDLISVTVSKWTRIRYELPEFPTITSGGERRAKAYDTTVDWLQRSIALMERWEKSRDEQKALRAKHFSMSLGQLCETLVHAEPDTWYIESAPDGFSARPVVPGMYAAKLLTPNARSLTFMSATIGRPDVLMAELGITSPYDFLSLPHTFPADNRPVFWLRNAPRIRNKSTDAEYKYQAEIISKVIQMHKGDKGLIHTASWTHARKLMELLSANGVSDRMMLAEGKRLETVQKFKNSDPGTVAISPSWKEGLNFPDEELRFAILAKVPFLSMGDPIIRLRLARPGGNDWYRWKAALEIVQASGRGVRSANDWCVTYLADGCWPQVAGYCPEWYQTQHL